MTTGLAFALVAFYAVTLAAWLIRRALLSRTLAEELTGQIATIRKEAASTKLVGEQLDEIRARLTKVEVGTTMRRAV